MNKKLITSGERYLPNKVRVKISRIVFCKIIFIFLCISEIVLGVLWALGY